MRKSLLVLLIALVGGLQYVAAISYRGFLDFNMGWSMTDIAKNRGISWESSLGGGNMTIGGTTSHGVQVLPKLFVGVGAGAHFIEGTQQFPVFAEGRVDLFGDRVIAPFFGVKLGYAIGTGQSSYVGIIGDWDSLNSQEFGLKSENCFYFQPSIGFRLRTAHRTGWNFALTYFTYKQQLVEEEYDYNVGETFRPLESKTRGYLGFVVGFDF